MLQQPSVPSQFYSTACAMLLIMESLYISGNIELPVPVKEAMQMQVEAERRKRANVIESEGKDTFILSLKLQGFNLFCLYRGPDIEFVNPDFTKACSKLMLYFDLLIQCMYK